MNCSYYKQEQKKKRKQKQNKTKQIQQQQQQNNKQTKTERTTYFTCTNGQWRSEWVAWVDNVQGPRS